MIKKKQAFLAQTKHGQKGLKKQKSEAKKVLLCLVALFSFIFKVKNFPFLLWPFYLDLPIYNSR